MVSIPAAPFTCCKCCSAASTVPVVSAINRPFRENYTRSILCLFGNACNAAGFPHRGLIRPTIESGFPVRHQQSHSAKKQDRSYLVLVNLAWRRPRFRRHYRKSPLFRRGAGRKVRYAWTVRRQNRSVVSDRFYSSGSPTQTGSSVNTDAGFCYLKSSLLAALFGRYSVRASRSRGSPGIVTAPDPASSGSNR